MVEFKNVSVAFHQNKKTVEAVRNVSLKIEKGDVFGIVGGSGAGKSTLLRTINLLQPVTGGDVLIDGRSVVGYKGAKLRELRKGVGMIFQHFNLAENKTVSQNIAFVLKTAGWKKDDIQKRVRELLEFVKLSDKADVYPSKLSGGQKQRVAIASAMLADKKILVFDEPTSGLDFRHMEQTADLLSSLNGKATVFVVTHDPELIERCCTHVLHLEYGEAADFNSL